MCFVRKLLDWVFTRHELEWLDDILPEAHKREKEEQKKEIEETMQVWYLMLLSLIVTYRWLMQKKRNSSALAMGLRLFCIKPLLLDKFQILRTHVFICCFGVLWQVNLVSYLGITRLLPFQAFQLIAVQMKGGGGGGGGGGDTVDDA